MVRKALSFLLALALLFSLATSASAAIVAPPERDNLWQGQVVAVPGGSAPGTAVAPSIPSYTAPAFTGNTFTASVKQPYSTFSSWIAYAKQINADATGWLAIPGTNVNHPIVQAPLPNDNNYYNYRDLWGRYFPDMTWRNFQDTTIYRDVNVVSGANWGSSSRNTVIYGHNWTNWSVPYTIGNVAKNTMFAQLPSYSSIDFARANPYIYYSDDQKEGIWKVFAVATVEVSNDFSYIHANPTDEYYSYILSEWLQRSRFNFGVDVNINDRILTLSTCTNEYGLRTDQRFVVVARLLRPGESENDATAVSVNPTAKGPQFVS